MNEMDVPTGGGWENLWLLLALAVVIGSWEKFREWRRKVAAAADAEARRKEELGKHFLTVQRENEGKIWARRWSEEGPQKMEPLIEPPSEVATRGCGCFLHVLGWLILLGTTGTAVWALLASEWWVLAFALPPTAGSWCMRLWIVRQKW